MKPKIESMDKVGLGPGLGPDTTQLRISFAGMSFFMTVQAYSDKSLRATAYALSPGVEVTVALDGAATTTKRY